MALQIKGNKTLFATREDAIKKVESLNLLPRQPALVKYLNEKGAMKIMLAFGTGEDKKVDYIGDYDGVYAPIDHVHNYAGSDIPGGPANSLKNAFGVLLDSKKPAITFNGSKNVSVDITPEAINASRNTHTHPTSKIVSLDGYVIGSEETAKSNLSTSDNLNKALGKIEFALHNLWDVNSITLTGGDTWVPGKIEFIEESPIIKFGTNNIIQKTGSKFEIFGETTFKNSILTDYNLTVKGTSSFIGASTFSNTVTINSQLTVKSKIIAGLDDDSDSIGTGAVIISGGVSIAKNLNIGGNTNIAKNLNVTGDITVTGKINAGTIIGNASSATKLQTPRKINGTDFDGTTDITTKYWGSARKIKLSGEVHGEISIDGTQDVDIKTTTTLAEDKPLVGLSISPTWKHSGGTSTSSSLVVEKGEKVDFSGTWKWVHNDNNKDPERTSGNWSTALPDSNTNSPVFEQKSIVNNTTFSQTIAAKQKGYKVVDNKVVAANAEDSKSASVSITFKDRLFYGIVNSLNPDEVTIEKLTSELVSSRGKTITGITCQKGQYYCYAYPEGLGNLTGIIQDGATPVLTAFNLTKLDITNAHGLKIKLNVYVSANDGAFNGSKLQFS